MIIFFFNVLVLILGFLSLSYRFNLSNPYLAIGFSYYLFLYLPGYYIIKYFFNKEFSSLEIFPLSLCCGYIFFMPLTILAYILSLKIKMFLFIYLIIISIFLLVVQFYLKPKYKSKFSKIKFNVYIISVFFIVFISFLMTDYYGGFISGNFLVHVTSIRKIYSLENISCNIGYFKDFPYTLNMYCIYYAFMAVISWISKLDPVLIWIYSPQFILPVGLIGFFCLAKRLFNSEKWALLFLVFYFLYRLVYNNYGSPADGYAWFHSENSACNNYIAIGVFFCCIMITILEYLNSGKKKLLFLLSLLFLTQGTIHLYSQFKTYFVLGCLFLWSLILKQEYFDYKKMSKIFIYSLFPGFLFFIYVFLLISPTVNPSYKIPNGTQGGLPLLFFGKWPLVDPSKSIFADPFFIWGTICFFVTAFFVRNDISAFYIFSIFFTVIFLIYNPLVLYIAAKFNPCYERITRIFNIIPFEFAVTFPFVFTFDKTKEKSFLQSNLSRIVLICFCIFFCIFLIKTAPQKLKKIVYKKEFSLSQLDKNKQLYELVREKIPPGSTVLVNIGLTTWWTTYFPHYIVAHTFDFVLPPNIDQTDRVNEVKYFYQNELGEKSIEILKKYKVDYIFILPEELKNKDFKKYNYFETVYSSPYFYIYKVKF